MKENKLPEEIQKIIEQNKQNLSQNPMDISQDSSYSTIEMKLYSFDVLGNKLFLVTSSDHVPYIQDYIDSINNGTPDKEGVIYKYATQYQKISESVMDRLVTSNNLKGIQSLPIKIIGELNKIELYLKPIIDAQVRDKKIQNLLDGNISENQ